MCHEIQVRKGGSKISAVNVGLSGALGEEQTVATRAKYIDSVVSRQVGQTHGQYGLSLAKHMGTSAKMGVAILFIHGVHAPVGDNIPARQKK